MPRIRSIRVEPFNSAQDVSADDVLTITADYASDVATAVYADHPCEDDSTCDIAFALDAGAPITAACILLGATECAHVDAVRCAHKFNGTLTDYSADMFAAPDWPVWKSFHDEHGRECESCGAYTYDDSETCGNCLAPLPVDTSEADCADHGLDECPDCGNVGVKIGTDGYEPCTRFRTCWAD